MEKWIDRLTFFQRFMLSPRLVGSVTPSSPWLVSAMLDPVPWEQIGSIAELGAGTGTLTEALHQQLPPDATVMVFEKDPVMGGMLQQRYPGFRHYKDAARLPIILDETGIKQVDVIVSSLPFAAFPQAVRDTILDAVWDSLSPDGWFIAFQYSLQAKKALHKRFEEVTVSFIPWNLPPAFVYTCRNPVESRK